MPNTATRLAAIRARLAAATPGPWEGDFNVDGTIKDVDGFVDYVGYLDVSPQDAELLVAAPADLTWALDRIEMLEKALAEMNERENRVSVDHGHVWFEGPGVLCHVDDDKPGCRPGSKPAAWVFPANAA